MEISVKIQKTIAIDDEESSDTMQLKVEVLDKTGVSSPHHRREIIVTADALEDGVTLDGLSIDKGSTLQVLLFPSTKTIKISITSLIHETITLEEKTSETIETIKAKIWNKTGISKDRQQLFFTEELENARTLADYNIQNESILTLKIRGEMQIFVKTLENNREVGVKSTDTVDYVKHKLQWKEAYAPDYCPATQRLTFAGKQLEGDRSLKYYKIEDSTL